MAGICPPLGWLLYGLLKIRARKSLRHLSAKKYMQPQVRDLKVQLFGGWEFPKNAAESENFAQIGYQYGVPMGGDLVPTNNKNAPSFILRAVKDPKGANLDRIQIIKGGSMLRVSSLRGSTMWLGQARAS